MSRLTRWTMVPAMAVAVGLLTTSTASALPASHTSGTAKATDIVYLVADLTGANEPRTVAATSGDPNGYGVEVVRIEGNEVRYAIAWDNILAPSAAHIHQGVTGVNGPIKVGLFGSVLPATVTSVVGRVTNADTAMLNSIKNDPGLFYANVHNAEYPGGAIRGQFRKLENAVDLDVLLGTGFLRAHLNGAEEVSDSGALGAGDLNGLGWAGIDVQGRRAAFALKWSGIEPPVAGHLHEGVKGVNGPIVVPLFAATGGLPKGVQGIGGYVRNLDAALLRRIRRNPAAFYANLHNSPFPAGAVRGQLRYRTDRELQALGF